MSNRGRNGVNHAVQFKGFITALKSAPEAKPMLPAVEAVLDRIISFARPVRNVGEAERQKQAVGDECRELVRALKERLPEDQLQLVPEALRTLSNSAGQLGHQHKLAREIRPVLRALVLPQPITANRETRV